MRRAWRNFKTHDLLFDDEASVSVPETLDPFDYLPPKVELSDYERNLIRQLDQTGKTDDMLGISRAWHRRGCSPEDHISRREQFCLVVSELQNDGFELSTYTREFFNNDHFVDRFRSGFTFGIEGLADLPDSESKLMDFLVDTHGGGRWSILASRVGCDAVVYEDEGGWHKPRRFDAIYLVADSFSEFLWRSSTEIIEAEREKPWITSQRG